MLNPKGWTWPARNKGSQATDRDPRSFWTSGTEHAASWTEEELMKRQIPQYVIDHAPYVHLFSGEAYWPSDMAEHLSHTSPYINYTAMDGPGEDRDLNNLDDLNDYQGAVNGKFAYLHSDDNVEEEPRWLRSEHNIPRSAEEGHTSSASMPQALLGPHGSGDSDPGETRSARHPDLRRRWRQQAGNMKVFPRPGGRSGAPAILLVVPKDDGVVDAFWFFFYSYNLGKKVLNIRFGNHVGDWEHTMMRFKDGKPHQLFLSEHTFGEAYAWHAIEKYVLNPDGSGTLIGTRSKDMAERIAKRPVVYSAEGSHAMYGSPGFHPYIVPWGILHDDTDRGPLWDPALNVKSFTYDLATRKVRASTLNPDAPVGWFDYNGHWGDKYYMLRDPRQYRFAGQYHYVNGPLGPKFKNLGRKEVCSGRGECKIRHWLGGSRAERAPVEEGETIESGGLPGGNITDE